jgi:hypothetical protein
MSVPDSSLLGIGGTPIKAALLFRHLCSMPPTNSSLLGLICTTLEAASFRLSAMSDANSSLNDLIGTPLKTALLQLSTMCDTNSSFYGSVGTSLMAAPLSSLCDSLATRLGFFNTGDNRLFIVYRLFHPRTDVND